MLRSWVVVLAVVALVGGCNRTASSLPDLGADRSATATCDDHLLDGDETDVDCGGGACPPCADGKRCLMGTDCVSAACLNNACIPAATCNWPCNSSGDCCSGFCSAGRCA